MFLREEEGARLKEINKQKKTDFGNDDYTPSPCPIRPFISSDPSAIAAPTALLNYDFVVVVVVINIRRRGKLTMMTLNTGRDEISIFSVLVGWF